LKADGSHIIQAGLCQRKVSRIDGLEDGNPGEMTDGIMGISCW
jgi:hypothetical protein